MRAPMTGFCEAIGTWGAQAVFPNRARDEARLSVLDTFGCILAGWDERQVVAAKAAFEGHPSAMTCALTLGTAAHALDFDDYEVPGSTHPSAPILGALLGLMSEHPHRIDRLLDAYLAGYEAIVRLGERLSYSHYNAGWHSTGTLGAVGAAAGCARLLGASQAQFAHAIAISSSLASGLKTQFGSDAKALHAGFAARAGIEAALLARAGAEGNCGAFEGPYGFLEIHHGPTEPAIRSKAGQRLGLEEYSVLRKPWPSCAYTHRVIDAALRLSARVETGQRIEKITLKMPEPFFRVAGFITPTTSNEARFSATYCVVAALLDGEIGPDSFCEDMYLRDDITALLGKTDVETYHPGPDLQDMSPEHPDCVAICLSDGTEISETSWHVRGGAEAPLTRDDLSNKFITCGGTEATRDLILYGDGSAMLTLSTETPMPSLSLAQDTI